jgi:hypothetical protein
MQRLVALKAVEFIKQTLLGFRATNKHFKHWHNKEAVTLF